MKKRVVMLMTLFASVFALASPLQAAALSGSDFNPGRIIDDAVFYDKDTMNAEQIQQFLNRRVPVCDTWGTGPSTNGRTVAERGRQRGSPPPYVCLKDHRQDTVSKPAEPGLCKGYVAKQNQSAAQIIYDVSQSCGINPQVLIVLLQKEQGLVDDRSPWPIQYRSATGYGCPDDAPCDTEFYGLFNQLYFAARQFKNYALKPQNFLYTAGRTNTLQLNPDARCGTTRVFIQNQATASLYNYTPYPPNQVALNNLFGEGNACSAYGNRNFWRNFNTWFGSTRAAAAKPQPPITQLPMPTSKPAPRPLPAPSQLPTPLATGLVSRPLLFGLKF